MRFHLAIVFVVVGVPLAGCLSGTPNNESGPGDDVPAAAVALPPPVDMMIPVAAGPWTLPAVACDEAIACGAVELDLEARVLADWRLDWDGVTPAFDVGFLKTGEWFHSRTEVGPGGTGTTVMPSGLVTMQFKPSYATSGEEVRLRIDYRPLPLRQPSGLPIEAPESTLDGWVPVEGSLQAMFEVQPGEQVEHAVRLDASVASLHVGAGPHASGATMATIHDPWGRAQCYFVSWIEPYGCSVPNAYLVDESWRIVASVGAGEPARTFTVTLHPDHPSTDPPLPDDLRFHVLPVAPDGGEMTVGALPDGTILVQQYVTTWASSDDGVTWRLVDEVPTSADPVLTVDPWGGVAWRAHWFQNGIGARVGPCLQASSTSDGGTWQPRIACQGVYADHPKLAAGAWMGMPVLYYLFYETGTLPEALVVARSLDGGVTWTPSRALDSLDGHAIWQSGGIAADQEGNVVIAQYAGDAAHEGIDIATSHDAGLSWGVIHINDVGRGRPEADLGVAVDIAGNFYVAYHQRDGVRYVASTDGGRTWSDPHIVSPPGLTSFNQVAAIGGGPGKLGITYQATPDSDLPARGVDGESAWAIAATIVHNATTDPQAWTGLATPREDPIQRGIICTAGAACPMARNLLDFIGAGVMPDGRMLVAFSDGCLDADCPTPADSRFSYGHLAMQTHGPLLFEGGAPWAD